MDDETQTLLLLFLEAFENKGDSGTSLEPRIFSSASFLLRKPQGVLFEHRHCLMSVTTILEVALMIAALEEF